MDLTELKSLYESRLLSLQSTLHSFMDTIPNDPLLIQMSEESSSSPFQVNRITELMSEVFFGEKERELEKYSNMIALLRGELTKREEEGRRRDEEGRRKEDEEGRSRDELESEIERERKMRVFFEEECRKEEEKRRRVIEDNEEILEVKELQLERQSVEIEGLRKKIREMEEEEGRRREEEERRMEEEEKRRKEEEERRKEVEEWRRRDEERMEQEEMKKREEEGKKRDEEGRRLKEEKERRKEEEETRRREEEERRLEEIRRLEEEQRKYEKLEKEMKEEKREWEEKVTKLQNKINQLKEGNLIMDELKMNTSREKGDFLQQIKEQKAKIAELEFNFKEAKMEIDLLTREKTQLSEKIEKLTFSNTSQLKFLEQDLERKIREVERIKDGESDQRMKNLKEEWEKEGKRRREEEKRREEEGRRVQEELLRGEFEKEKNQLIADYEERINSIRLETDHSSQLVHELKSQSASSDIEQKNQLLLLQNAEKLYHEEHYKNEELNKEVVKLRSKIQQLQQMQSSSQNNTNSNVITLQQNLSSLQASNYSYSEQIKSLNNDITDLQKSFQVLEDKNSALILEIETTRTKLFLAEKLNSSLQSSSSSLQASLQSLDSQLREENSRIKSELSLLSSQLSIKSTENRDLHQVNKRKDQRIRELEEEESNLKRVLSDLNDKLEGLGEENRDLEKNLEDRSRKLELLVRKIGGVRSSLGVLKERVRKSEVVMSSGMMVLGKWVEGEVGRMGEREERRRREEEGRRREEEREEEGRRREEEEREEGRRRREEEGRRRREEEEREEEGRRVRRGFEKEKEGLLKKVEVLEKEVEGKKQELFQMGERIDQIQKDTLEGIEKMKRERREETERRRREEEEGAMRRLESLAKMVNGLKIRHLEKLDSFVNDIDKLGEVFSLKAEGHSEKLLAKQKTINDQQLLIETLSSELNSQVLSSRHLKDCDAQIEDFKLLLKQENERFLCLKAQSKQEIESLREELHAVRLEGKKKEILIEELKRTKSEQGKELRGMKMMESFGKGVGGGNGRKMELREILKRSLGETPEKEKKGGYF